MSTHYRHKNILIYKPSSLNHPKSIPVYPWTTDFLSQPMDWALLYALTDQEIYIINISQRPQSHKYGLNQLKLIPGSHTQTGEQKQNRHTSFTFKAISQHLHLFFSLSLSRGKRYHILKVQGDERTRKEKRRNIMFPLPSEEEKASEEGHCRQEEGMR